MAGPLLTQGGRLLGALTLLLLPSGCGGPCAHCKRGLTLTGPSTTPPSAATCDEGVAATNGIYRYDTVDEAVSKAELGDVVVICEGTWPVQGLAGTGTLAIRGETGDPADVVLEPSTGGGTILAFGRSAGIQLQHLTFRGATRSAVTVADATKLVVENCVFEDNHGDVGGGAIAAQIGGTADGDGHNLWIRGSRFVGNEAPQGGAIELALHDDARVLIEDSELAGNAADEGGAVYVLPISGSDSLTTFDGTTFTDNTASRDGGAVAMHGPGTAYWSGCVATGNYAGNAGGAYLMAPPSGSEPHQANLETGVITGNTADGVLSGAVHLERGWELAAAGIDFGGTTDPNLPKDINVCTDVSGWNSFTVDSAGCHHTSR